MVKNKEEWRIRKTKGWCLYEINHYCIDHYHIVWDHEIVKDEFEPFVCMKCRKKSPDFIITQWRLLNGK